MKNLLFGLRIYAGSILIFLLCLLIIYGSNQYAEYRICWRESLPQLLANFVISTSVAVYINYSFYCKDK